MRARKFRRGEPFADIGELAFWLSIGNWVYWRDRPKHPSILENQRLGTLRGLIKAPAPYQIVRAVAIVEDLTP